MSFWTKIKYVIAVDDEEIKKAEGINKDVIKNMRHKQYLDVLFNIKMMRHEMKRIQSRFHKIETYNVSKIYLSCFDNKRYTLSNDIKSLAYFHKDVKINEIKEINKIN